MTNANGNMEPRIRSGIELDGNVLRYAEVEKVRDRFRLVRLGSCEFDFDLAGILLDEGSSEHLETVGDALHDVFSGSKSEILNVGIHPTDCYSYVASLPAGMRAGDAEKRIRDELSFVLGDPDQLHVEADGLSRELLDDGSEIDYVHILAVPQYASQRLGLLAPQLVQKNQRLVVSTQGAARIVDQMINYSDVPPADDKDMILSVGIYEGYSEYALSRKGTLVATYYSKTTTVYDTAYFATALLARNRLKPHDLAQLCLYGSEYESVDLQPVMKVFGDEAIRLNPVAVVTLDPSSLTSSFDSEAYVPCIGINL